MEGAGAFFAKTAAHGSVCGVLSVLQEGKFGHGFIGAGIAKGFSLAVRSFDSGVMGEFLSATLAGGTVSELTGGKFANGAQTAAIAYLVTVKIKVDLNNEKITSDNFDGGAVMFVNHLDFGGVCAGSALQKAGQYSA